MKLNIYTKHIQNSALTLDRRAQPHDTSSLWIIFDKDPTAGYIQERQLNFSVNRRVEVLPTCSLKFSSMECPPPAGTDPGCRISTVKENLCALGKTDGSVY